jgi:hypothetical protein
MGIFLWDGQGYHGENVIGTPNHNEILYGEEFGEFAGYLQIWRIASAANCNCDLRKMKIQHAHTQACLDYKQDMTGMITSKPGRSEGKLQPTDRQQKDVDLTNECWDYNHPKEGLSSANTFHQLIWGLPNHIGSEIGKLKLVMIKVGCN